MGSKKLDDFIFNKTGSFEETFLFDYRHDKTDYVSKLWRLYKRS